MTKGEFHLVKITRNGGGLTVDYTTTLETDGIGAEVTNRVCDPREIHEDLRVLFDRLGIVAELILSRPQQLTPLSEHDAMVSLPKISGYPTPYITQVQFADGIGSTGLILSGVVTTDFGTVKFKTPRLRPTSESLGVITGIIEDSYQSLFDEVYAYLFEGKQAQLSLFGAVSGEELVEEEGILMEADDAED